MEELISYYDVERFILSTFRSIVERNSVDLSINTDFYIIYEFTKIMNEYNSSKPRIQIQTNIHTNKCDLNRSNRIAHLEYQVYTSGVFSDIKYYTLP